MSTATLKEFDSLRLGDIQGLGLSKMVAPIQGNAPDLEGEFTSYASKWTATISNVFAKNGEVSGDNVFFQDDWNLDTIVRALSDGSAVDSDAFTTDLAGGINQFLDSSVTGKYVIRRTAADGVEVWKRGVLLQTITIGGAGQDIQGISISSNGKYIFIADEANDTLFLYEGS